MSKSWWDKKLGNAPERQPFAFTVQAPQQQPQPAPVAAQPVQEQQPAPVHTKPVLDPNRPENAEITMGEAMRLWQGGQANRMEGHLACPSCGSSTGYTEYSASLQPGGRPRPHCFECGYNGAYQQGDQANWA